MGSVLGINRRSKEDVEMALTKVKHLVSTNPVVVFSKTYCGYCTRVKQLFTQLGVAFLLLELDQEQDGGDIQAALAQWTARTTVPNVFIGGQNVGGCDSVMGLNESGQLKDLLAKAADAIASNPVEL